MEMITVGEAACAVGGKLISGDPQTKLTSVCIDSRQVGEGALFVPIIGEKVDAHTFIPQVFESGAAATLTSHGKIFDSGKPHILVDNTEKAIGELAAWYMKKFPIPVVGITGSVGKTSTKEMVAAALGVKFNVLKTAGNQNSQIGVPLTVFRIGKEHEMAVVEMGISDFKEMDDLVHFVHPQTAVVTNIGVAHIAQLGTRENILSEKLRIAQEFTEVNPLFLNASDPLLLKASEKLPYAVLFGMDGSCPYRGDNVRIVDGKTNFTFIYPEGQEEVVINQIGMHNVYNAIVAMAIGMHYGIHPSQSKEGLLAYEGIAMRQQINHLKDGIKVIDDTYNASPDSIKSGISVLVQLDNTGRKIAVLGDVLELGAMSRQCHYDTGKDISTARIDEVITVGTEMKVLAQAIADSDSLIKVVSFENNGQAADYLKGVIRANDAILAKGSRGMHLEEIVEALKEVYKI